MSGEDVDVDALLAESDSVNRDNTNGSRGRRSSREGDDYISLAAGKDDRASSKGHDRERRRSGSPPTRRDPGRANGRYGRSRSPRGRRDNGSYRHPDSRRDPHRGDRGYGRRHDDRNREYRPRYSDSRYSRHDRHYEPRSRTPPPAMSNAEAERHTLFVSQCAGRLNSPELMAVFRDAGLDVANAEMVRDRIHSRNPRDKGRHKGMAYVDFKTPEGAAAGLNLTGKPVLGVPLLIQVTEAEKNNQVRVSTENGDGVPFHRLYITNMSYQISDADMLSILEVYGEVANFHVDREEGSEQNKGSCWVEYVDPNCAKLAYESSKHVDLAGRILRFGFGNSRVSEASTKRVLDRWPQSMAEFNRPRPRSPRPNSGGGSGGLRRARPAQEGGPSSALEDVDNYNRPGANTRYAVMQKLLRNDEPSKSSGQASRPASKPSQPSAPQQVTRNIKLQNCFDYKKVDNEPPEFFEELRAEIEQECKDSYGPVLHSAIDQNSQGDGYIRFANAQDAKRAYDSLNGRFFAGLRLGASYVPDLLYNLRYPRSG